MRNIKNICHKAMKITIIDHIRLVWVRWPRISFLASFFLQKSSTKKVYFQNMKENKRARMNLLVHNMVQFLKRLCWLSFFFKSLKREKKKDFFAIPMHWIFRFFFFSTSRILSPYLKEITQNFQKNSGDIFECNCKEKKFN